MLSRRRSGSLLLSALAILLLAVGSCERVPLLAPSGSIIMLTATDTALSANGTTEILGQVLESAGVPPHSGTHVTFTTTLGRIEPSETTTDLSGRVQATFIAGGANGTATIRALSGGAITSADASLKIAVGTAAVGKVAVNATPAAIPAIGGSSTITATVLDINGNALVGAPVSFSTTAGILSSSLSPTSGNGVASTLLTTNQTATVTASVGATAATPPATTPPTTTTATGQASGSVIVTVLAAPSVTITAPTTPVTKGIPATFTLTIPAATATSLAIREVTVNWGDGTVDNVGSFTGTQQLQHTFRNDGNFRVSATVTDVAGGTSTVSTTVGVILAPRPTITVTPSAAPRPAGSPVTFAIAVTPPAGITVQSTSISYGDGTASEDLGGATSAQTVHRFSAAGTYPVTVSVTDSTGQTTNGSTSVAITP